MSYKWRDDKQALKHLLGKVRIVSGVISPTVVLAEKDISAINYLVAEWSFGWDGRHYNNCHIWNVGIRLKILPEVVRRVCTHIYQ